METKKNILQVAGFIFLAILVSPLYAQTIIVDQQGGGDYLTISEGVSAASAGATVLVMPGVYPESITLNVEITLQGYDPYTTMIYSGVTAITCQAGSGQAIIKGFDIWSGDKGISVQNGSSVIIENNIIHNCSDGIFSDCVCTIRNNIIKNCSGNGILLWYDNADAIIVNNIIHDCAICGINMDEPPGNSDPDPTVINNIVFQNDRGIVVWDNGPSQGIFAYNDVWNNSIGNWINITPGPGNISEDPLFVDFDSGNYHLQTGSPCIDSGQPGTAYQDPNGTTSDMGIFGGPNCWGGGAPGVTDVQVIPESVPQGGTVDINASGTVQ